MNKQFSVVAGVALVLLGILALCLALVIPMLGLSLWFWGPWRLWPLLVVGLGLLLVAPPVLVRGRPGLGLLFIPGLPVLTTGAILSLASVLDWWNVWEWLWPQEVLALGFGFLFAAIYMGSAWLTVPAIIVGLNGMVFQFCALTGLWEAWAALWTIEPLALGMALLVLGGVNHRRGLFTAGLVVCGLAGMALIAMAGILTLGTLWRGWWLANLITPGIIILSGFLLLAWGVLRRKASPGTALEKREGMSEVLEPNR